MSNNRVEEHIPAVPKTFDFRGANCGCNNQNCYYYEGKSVKVKTTEKKLETFGKLLNGSIEVIKKEQNKKR